MTGCGKIKHLVQPLAQRIVEPKIVEKEVEKIVYVEYPPHPTFMNYLVGTALIGAGIYGVYYVGNHYYHKGYNVGFAKGSNIKRD